MTTALVTDWYELIMANASFQSGNFDEVAYFDVFFRNIPQNGGFALFAGLESVIKDIQNLKFGKDDIDFLRSKKVFSEKFLQNLIDFKFECDIWSFAEGVPIFPNEPIMIVRGPFWQAQLIEVLVLQAINHQSLIATKASRLVRVSGDRGIMEFGARRAHGADASIYGARSCYIAGFIGTSNVEAARLFGIPAMGTMGHSWVQSFNSEFEAFAKYARVYPDNCSLLIDTYNVQKSGIINAIRAHNEVLLPMGKRLSSVRIDSGDIAYISRKVRAELDKNDMQDTKIIASNALDEYIIRDLIGQNARIDLFGVGEKVITSFPEPIFDGVYKLSAIEKNGEIIPKIKISENIGKITDPGFKKVLRLYSKEDSKAIADVISLHDEFLPETIDIFDPNHTWKKKTLSNFVAKEMLIPIFKKGKLIYNLPKLDEIRAFAKGQVDSLWEEVKRFENPHQYYVDLTPKLWELKQSMLK